MRIVLISPKGPLYRHRGGIFKKSLRYMPLTLTTLASLVPAGAGRRGPADRRGHRGGRPDAIEADLVGLTVITGTAPRAYELAARVPRARHPGGARRAARDAGPRRRPAARRRHRRRLRRGDLARAAARLRRPAACAALRPARPASRWPACRSRGAICCRASASSPTTSSRRPAAASTTATSASCPRPGGASRYQKPVEDVVADIRQQRARKLIFVDLNLIADRDYAARLFEALIPLQRPVVRPGDRRCSADDAELLALAAAERLPGPADGARVDLARRTCATRRRASTRPERYRELVRRLCTGTASPSRAASSSAWTTTRPTSSWRPPASRSRRRSTCRASPSSRRSRARPLYQRLESEGRILTRNWELYDGQHVVFQPAQMSVERAAAGHRDGLEARLQRAVHAEAPGVLAEPAGRCGSAPTSATASTPTTCTASTTATGSLRPGPGAESARMRLTLVHPCIGRRAGDRSYIRTWQMEPLPPALIAGLTPPDVEVRFYDDRMEQIPFDEPTDLVAISRRDLHRQARLPDRQRVPAPRRAGRDGRLPRQPLPGRGGALRRARRGRRGRGALAAR